MRVKRAIISVTDKRGITDFAKALEEKGVEIISTGGTAKTLEAAGVRITKIDDYTGFPEMMDGRVKTLHPKVHGGILCVRDNPEHLRQAADNDIQMIDMVVVNLYQFAKTVSDPNVTTETAIENIDIGGPALLRSAAKNYRDVVVVSDPSDYALVLDQLNEYGDVDLKTRELLALKVFKTTSNYDGDIDKFLSKRFADEDVVRLRFGKAKTLRYGENWHQAARVYVKDDALSVAGSRQVQGKEMSYNNYLDAESACEAAHDLKSMGETGAVIVKHNNPCGYATGSTLREALEQAWAGDPLSAFGGVIALTKKMDRETAEFLKNKFVEIVIAPSFDDEALEALKNKKDLRLLELGEFVPERVHHRLMSGALLEQDRDTGYATTADFRTVTEKEFPADKRDAALFACLACKHTKSNSITIAREYKPGFFQLVGMGAGQPNRIMSLRIAAEKARENIDSMELDRSEISRCVLASDSFFPFPDSIEEANKQGIRFIVQPGGSVKDNEVIEACNSHGIAMTFTGRRMFRH